MIELIWLILVCLVVGLVAGYMLATHIHSVAAKAASAVTRAATIPGHDVAALNAKIDGLGDKVQSLTAAAAAPAVAAIQAAPAALAAAAPSA